MINKQVRTLADATSGLAHGATIMIGGFGGVGQPTALVEALLDGGARDLTAIANNAGLGRTGLARLMEAGQIRRVVCSYPRSADSVVSRCFFLP